MSDEDEKIEFKVEQPATLPVQPEECCDTQTERKIPDELREPESQPPEQPEELLVPRGLNVKNHTKKVEATDHFLLCCSLYHRGCSGLYC